MTFQVMTDDICHSKHGTRLEAGAEIVKLAKITVLDVADLMKQAIEALEYQESLVIVEVKGEV